MVKADLTRDYYADLGLQPGASDSEIKKQFRQLALKYHPDRNPGREAEVNSKFQTIQSAHEVLTDAEQKAKYDSARLRSNTTRTYSGFGATTTASGTRGNPWSSAGSEWAPPPKPPPPRDAERRKPPPTSAGAARYANFATPNGTAPKATQNAEARRKNYEAWESMRPPQPPPPRAWQPPKPVPKEYTPQSGREESNSKQYAPPPKSSRPGYEEFRAGASSSHSDRTSPSRSYSTRESPRKNGFMPGTPGPDEPPAFNASAYFSRNSRPSSRRQAEAPEPPPREQPPRPAPPIDPLRQFREKDGTPFEPRLSTPYATHGGEKTNPFESINLNRSKSTREPVDNTNSTNAAPSRPSGASERHRSASPPRTRHGRNLSPEPGIARADSDIHLGSSPKRTYSSANKTYLNTESSRPQPRYTPPVEPISSDGDDSDSDKRQTSFGTRSRTFAKRRAAQTNTRPKENQVPSGGPGSSTGENDERPRKPSLAEFQQWWSSSERKRNALNDVLPDGNANRGNGKEDGPSMYANPKPFIILSHSAAKRSSTLPTVVEEQSFLFSGKSFPQISQQFAASSEDFTSVKKQRPNPATPMTYESPPDSPSGASILTPPGALTSFETTQRKVVEGLLGIRSKLANSTCDVANEPRSNDRGGRNLQGKQPSANECLPKAESISVRPSSLSGDKPHLTGYSECLSSWETGSPSYKIRRCNPPCSISFNGAESIRLPTIKNFTKANMPFASSFSFNAGDETLKSRGPTQNAFTSSAENINTTFTPEDWNGKFEAGEHFTNDGANMKGGSRARSGSRPRTRSPVKGRPISRSQPGSARPPVPHIEPEILQPATDSEQPSSSPGGTKFTPEEWARTFKPQNFAPPPFVSSTGGGRSPLRNARRSRTGSSAAKPLNATKTAMASEGDSSDSPLEIGKRTAQPTATSGTNDSVPPAGTDSPNAMDIDPPFHEQSDTPRHPPDNGFMASNDAANEARNVPVEPSRSEWRAGDASGSDIPVPLVPLKQPELPPRTGRRTTKSADEEDFRTNLEDLKNVEPLQHPATGLHSFDDLTSTLPFQSQAASRLTIPRNFSSGELDLPHPPRAPMVPITKATRPSMAQWESYLLAFKTYMAEWDIFNTKMIIHFVARKSQVDRMKLGWLEAFGDSDLEKYREGLVEDFKVRQWWDVACEKHQDAIEKFQFFKGCMREGGPPQRGPTVAN